VVRSQLYWKVETGEKRSMAVGGAEVVLLSREEEEGPKGSEIKKNNRRKGLPDPIA